MLASQTHIYKSNARGILKSELFSRYSIFNFDEYRSEAALPFGTIEAFNEETLCVGNNVVRQVDGFIDIVIIPLTGSIFYKDSLGNRKLVDNRQIGIFSVQEGMAYELMNFGESQATYLQIWLRADQRKFDRQFRSKEYADTDINELHPIFAGKQSGLPVLKTNSDTFGSMGVYQKGKGGRYVLKGLNYGLFAFVINGIFKLEGRVLRQRDAISLNAVSGVEFKATSEDAAILLIESPY